MINVKIRENSMIAKIAAFKLKANAVAMVVGKTIYLYNTSREAFLSNISWVRHEVVHVRQYQQLGLMKFIFLYLIETLNKGYQNNRFEVDARAGEMDEDVLSEIEFA